MADHNSADTIERRATTSRKLMSVAIPLGFASVPSKEQLFVALETLMAIARDDLDIALLSEYRAVYENRSARAVQE